MHYFFLNFISDDFFNLYVDFKNKLPLLRQENPLDAQGLSDRRACLAIILAATWRPKAVVKIPNEGLPRKKST